ncbi:MAG TPA: carboxypeptidase regulatory-like domain-containing protein, partial [Pyrinomonadaceae bacterium]|nr:carboxypeptidase regulatory-like domain-containing protein [Pyrinomonadaceae bacterium]
MRSSTLVCLISVAMALVAADLRAQTKQTLRSTISGQVTIKGKPIPGLVVGLRGTDGVMLNTFEVLPRATTDQDGNYRITNVSPGTYAIQPAAPAYVLTSPLDPSGRSVIVGEGETIENI